MDIPKEWITCCTCKHHTAEQELTQDRLDVDIKHHCLEVDDYYYLDEDYGKKGCKHFEMSDEAREGYNQTAYTQMELVKEKLGVLFFETPFPWILLVWIIGVIVILWVFP
jgi:ABC-type Zn2+ transport system substrate-binding protein/surface adhesin